VILKGIGAIIPVLRARRTERDAARAAARETPTPDRAAPAAPAAHTEEEKSGRVDRTA
jgi:hypothetical protein